MSHADRITKIRLTLLFGIGMLALTDARALTPLTDIVQIAAGSHMSNSCALTRQGGVKCWGMTGFILSDGDMDYEKHPTPVDMPGLTQDIVAVATGGGLSATCALTRWGGVKCQGREGVVGDGTAEPRPEPVDVVGLNAGVAAISVSPNRACALTAQGGVKCWGGGPVGDGSTNEWSLAPVDVVGLGSGVRAIAVGWTHTCALTVTGGVKCWGNGGLMGDAVNGQQLTPLDVPGLGSGVAAITASERHTCALTVTGGVKCWGFNDAGQLGNGAADDSNHLISYPPADVVGLTSGVVAIAAGPFHTCALTVDKQIKCWGYNGSGQLGDGSTQQRQRPTPVEVVGLDSSATALALGLEHTCALMETGGVKCWGSDVDGQLGGGIPHQRLTPIDVTGLNAGVARVAAGGLHTCALTPDGNAKCWGANDKGQLGDGTQEQRPSPVDVNHLDARIAVIDTGQNHTCARTRDKRVQCWGTNDTGQLGDGTKAQRLQPVEVEGLDEKVTAISTGGEYTCALTVEKGVKCWGSNRYGQLGDGTRAKQRLLPVQVSGLDNGIAEISAGYGHACARTQGNRVKCWGRNREGQLGDSTTKKRLAPVEVTGLDADVNAIAVGGWHTCALMKDGIVKCWGKNRYGQLGDGTTEQRLGPVNVIGLPTDIVAIATGSDHTCALADSGKIHCWGRNSRGQLGDGTTEQPLTSVEVSGIDTATQVTAGASHTCASTPDKQVKCWGDNYSGQLGDGTATIQPIPGDVMVDDK